MKIIKLLNKKFYEEVKNKTTVYYNFPTRFFIINIAGEKNITDELSADKPVSKEWRYKSSYRNSQSSKYWKFNNKKR